MRSARVYMHGELAGILDEIEQKRRYRFRYLDTYAGKLVGAVTVEEVT